METDMARNKYPEETHQLILDVSTKLFFESLIQKENSLKPLS